MNEFLSRAYQQLTSLWQEMPPGRRRLTVGAAGAVFVFVLVLAFYFGRTEYVPLYTNVRPEEAADIISTLRESGVDYRLADAGTTVLVPASKVYELRIDLAHQGLGGSQVVGFESFTQSQLGMTDFDRRVKYNWALQGELVRTIRRYAGVRDARVHVAIPEDSVFMRQESEPSASVLLELRPGSRLSESSVKGIAYLVASSVERLRPERVTILDTSGNVLYEGHQPENAFVNEDAIVERIQVQQAYARQLENSVQSMLERVFGIGKAVVRVRADLDFDYREEKRESFVPQGGRGGLVRSEQEVRETYSGNAQPSGVPGVSSNVPGYVASAAGSGEFERVDITRNYELDRIESHMVEAPGQISQLSVAVWVDSVEEDRLAAIENTVATALGLKPERGDEIIVESLPFAALGPEGAVEAPGWQKYADAPYVWFAALMLVALLTVGGFVLLRSRRQASEEAQPHFEVLIGEEEAAAAAEGPPEEDERTRLLAELRQRAEQNPEQVAQVLRSWLYEE